MAHGMLSRSKGVTVPDEFPSEHDVGDVVTTEKHAHGDVEWLDLLEPAAEEATSLKPTLAFCQPTRSSRSANMDSKPSHLRSVASANRVSTSSPSQTWQMEADNSSDV